MDTMDRNTLIRKYFEEGYQYRSIVIFLRDLHGIFISLRTLKRILKALNLRRRANVNDTHVRVVMDIVKRELRGSGRSLGYRSMWRRVRRKYKIPVARRTVMCILAYLDPAASLRRQARRLSRRVYSTKGPNDVWHVDGNDKLVPYGFHIHGCIDGFSRRIMWLKVGVTNKDPKVIASFYLAAVQSVGGCPRLVRSDLGSENSILAYLQPFLRRYHTDSLSGIQSFRYGSSTHNQRIECLWSQLGKWCTYWWRELFQGMVYHGLYSTCSAIHQRCARLCFTNLIQTELDQFSSEWNTHHITLSRSQRQTNAVGGIPNELFFLPTSYGHDDQKCSVEILDVECAKSRADSLPPPVDLEFAEIAAEYMRRRNLELPSTVEEALMLFVELVHHFEML